MKRALQILINNGMIKGEQQLLPIKNKFKQMKI